MKAKKLFWGIIILIPMLFTACELEQTSLNADAIKGQAVIKGRVLYKSGEIQSGNYVNEIWNPAKGQTVHAYINNSDLTGNALATGETVYTTTIDSSGNYEFTLPATTSGYNVVLMLSNFEGKYSTGKGINATSGSLEFEYRDGYYTSGMVVQYIENSYKYIVDMDNYTFNARTVLQNLETRDFVKVSGAITYTAEKRSADSTSVSTIAKAAVGKKVLISCGSSLYSAVTKSIVVGDTETGVYEFYLPVGSDVENTTIDLYPVSYESTYTRYIKTGTKYSTSKSIKGKYSCNSSTTSVKLEKGLTSFISIVPNYSFTEYPDYAQ